MVCPNCGHDNPAGTKFCGECGRPLAVPCPNCSAANSPTNRFCGECGTVLGTTAPAAATQPVAAASPTRAERRVVSVLFADLVGFTPFSESRDPEEVRELLTRYFDRSREIVARFRGTVDKFIGDAVMAWWGAVEATEDDAERAVRAALELVDMVSNLGGEIGGPRRQRTGPDRRRPRQHRQPAPVHRRGRIGSRRRVDGEPGGECHRAATARRAGPQGQGDSGQGIPGGPGGGPARRAGPNRGPGASIHRTP